MPEGDSMRAPEDSFPSVLPIIGLAPTLRQVFLKNDFKESKNTSLKIVTLHNTSARLTLDFYLSQVFNIRRPVSSSLGVDQKTRQGSPLAMVIHKHF